MLLDAQQPIHLAQRKWSSRGRSSRREGSDADPPLLRAARVRHLAPVMNQQDHHPPVPTAMGAIITRAMLELPPPPSRPDPGFTLSSFRIADV